MNSTKLTLAVESHSELAERINRRISMESDALTTFVDTIRESLPSLMNSATKMFENISFFKSEPGDKATIQRMNVVRMLDKHNYAHISALAVLVPEGFQGSLVDYTEVLKKCSFHAAAVTSDVLNPYNTFLSQLLSSQNARMSNYGNLGFLNNHSAEREKLNKAVGEFFKSNSHTTKQPYGKVLRRNADWNDVVQNLPLLDKTINSVDRETVQRAVDDCVSLIDSIKKAADDGTLDNLSGAMIKQLSQATLIAAKEVEFYAITAHRIATLTKVMDDSLKSIETALK